MSEVSQITLPLHVAVQYVLTHMEAHWRGEKMSTPYLAGVPGGGKSEMLKNECEKRGIGFLPITVGLIRPERFTGIPEFKKVPVENIDEEKSWVSEFEPYIEENDKKYELHTTWSLPELVSMMRTMSKKYEKVLVLYDDFHMASPEIQASGFETFTYHSINGYKIPPNVGIALAGNTSTMAGARAGFSAIANRICKIHCVTDFEYWLENFAIPNNLDNEIISFLDSPSHRSYFHGEEDTKEPWPSPRSWTECARAIKALKEVEKINTSSEIGRMVFHNVIASHVGLKSAAEFMIYHEIYSKVNARGIFENGAKWKVPSESLDKFAFGAAVTEEFYNQTERGNDSQKLYNEYGKMIEALSKENANEIIVRALRYLTTKNPDLPVTLANKAKTISKDTLQEVLTSTRHLRGD